MGTNDDIIQAESSGDPNAPAKTSSALGLGQFLKGTWLDMMRRYYPTLVEGKSDAEILELRKDPFYSLEMTRKYAEENDAKLREAGIPVTPGSTYLMHFAGPSGGIALMKADPNTPVESILSDQAIKANPYLQGKTASWVIAWANKKMADAAKSSVKLQPAQPVPYVAQTQAVEPAFGATSWPQHPTSPNMLPPDAARPFAGTSSVAPTPFVDGTIRAQQALGNSIAAPGVAIGPRTQPVVPFLNPTQQNPLGGGMAGWSASTGGPYAGGSNTVVPPTGNQPPRAMPSPLTPGMAIPGAVGPTSVGGPSGPTPLMAQANSAAPARPAPSSSPPLHFAPETPQNFGPFTAPSRFDASGDLSAVQKPGGLPGMMIDAGLVPNWREILSEPIGSPNLVDTWMRQGSRTPGAIGSPAAPLQATAANSFQPFGTSGQFAPGSTTSSQPLYDTRSFAAPSDGSAEAEDRKNIRVLRRFIEAPDGSLIPDPLTGPDQPQSVQTSDLLSSKPMTSNPPPIFGFGDRSATSDDDDDFFSRFIKPLLQQ